MKIGSNSGGHKGPTSTNRGKGFWRGGTGRGRGQGGGKMGNSGGRGRGYGGRRGGRGGNSNFDPLACYRCRVRGHLARDCPSTGNQSQTLGSSNTSSFRGTFSKSGQKGPRGRGRGRQVRFGALNMLYDEDGNSYPADDGNQLYIPLEFAQDVGDGEFEEENSKGTKNLKRSYASVATVGATCDSTSVGSQKKNKNWRKSVKYLHSRIDRARFWRREGSVLVADMVALRQEMEREAGQR